MLAVNYVTHVVVENEIYEECLCVFSRLYFYFKLLSSFIFVGLNKHEKANENECVKQLITAGNTSESNYIRE